MPRQVDYSKILNRLLYSWAICYGAITLLAVAGYCVPTMLMPVLAFALMIAISVYRNYREQSEHSSCLVSLRFTSYILFFSGVVMLIFNLVNRGYIGGLLSAKVSPYYPFISSAIVYPMASAGFLLAIIRRGKSWYCQYCRDRAGFSVKDTLERNLFHHEAKSLIYMAFYLSLVISVIVLTYYSLFYINVNINRPDTFFFFITPIVLYALSVGYVASRFSSLKFKITMARTHHGDDFYTIVRFIVVRDDKILLEEMKANDKDTIGLWDTPAMIDIKFTDRMDDADAREMFASISGCNQFVLKPLFTSSTDKHNVLRFAAILDDPNAETPGLEGEWLNIYQIDMMLKDGEISRPFAYDIHRIYTMTMAWKTYNLDGKRLYPIRNYRPTFRLADFRDWDLDYNDMRWLSIAENNEDKPLFRLRRFFSKFITGEHTRWRRSQS